MLERFAANGAQIVVPGTSVGNDRQNYSNSITAILTSNTIFEVCE